MLPSQISVMMATGAGQSNSAISGDRWVALARRLTFKGWLKRLPNEVIWRLANEWRRDFQRTEAIENEYKRRLRQEEKKTKAKKGHA